ncbi:ABC transporter G family member 1-like isoform X3 [Syzygium oleosum]|nr:ABC transporter G family member 1-like isoform X3 [Syzygium oleosum]
MSKSEKKERAEATIKEMGLQDARDTRIGGASAKGLSGGQKRRVSICIEILTRPKLLFLDEPTSGLDSAASYHVMNRIAKLARHDRRTVIASIHQPSSEVFLSFSTISAFFLMGKQSILASDQRQNSFLHQMVSHVQLLEILSDHYLRTINKDFDADIEQGGNGMNAEEAIDTLVKSYLSSLVCH